MAPNLMIRKDFKTRTDNLNKLQATQIETDKFVSWKEKNKPMQLLLFSSEICVREEEITALLASSEQLPSQTAFFVAKAAVNFLSFPSTQTERRLLEQKLQGTNILMKTAGLGCCQRSTGDCCWAAVAFGM